MSKRFTSDEEGNILDDGDILTVEEVLEYLNWYRRDMLRFSVENEQLEKGKMEALSLLGEEIDKNEQLKKENRQMAEKLFILNEKYGL